MQIQNSDHSQEPAVNLLPEIDLKVYLRILWHWAWLIVLCVVLAAVSAYVASSLAVPIYQSTATLLIDQASTPTATYQDILTNERIARTYAELMQRKRTLRSVAERLGLEADVLESAITEINVTPTRDTQLVQVQIEGIAPQLVALVANQLPLVFIEELNQIQTEDFAESKASLETQLSNLRGQIETTTVEVEGLNGSRTAEEEIRLAQLRDELAEYQSSYTTLLGKYEELRLIELQSTDSITVVEEAEQPEEPIRPRVLVNTLLAAIVGGMLALGVVFLIEYMDDRIKSPQDLYTILDAPILGTVAHMGSQKVRKQRHEVSREDALISASQPRHPITESYRRLRTNLRFSSVNEPTKVILLTSATPSEGKTTTAANLAAVVAQAGHRVVLIDADLRKPQLHKVFNLSKGPGLTDALLSGGESSFFLRETELSNLQLLTCGSIPPNPAELLGSKPMQRILEQLQHEVDLIIIDAPPILAVSDAQILSGFAQGVLLVVNTEQTARGLVASAATALQQVDARLLGVVLNKMTRSPRSYYYYDAYASYYAEASEEEIAESTPMRVTPAKVATATKASNAPTTATATATESTDQFQIQADHGQKNGYYQLTPKNEKS